MKYLKKYEEIQKNYILEDQSNKDIVWNEIRLDLLESLKTSDHEEIKRCTLENIQNNKNVVEEVDLIIEKLDEQIAEAEAEENIKIIIDHWQFQTG